MLKIRGYLAEFFFRLSITAERRGDRLKAKTARAYDGSNGLHDISKFFDGLMPLAKVRERRKARRKRPDRRVRPLQLQGALK